MKKIVIHSPGNYNKLQMEEYPDPVLKTDNDVLIEVKFIGVNYADVVIRWGLYRSAKEFVGWPVTPGFEVSGIVKSLGKNVLNLQVGDAVLGITCFGGYATQIVLNSEFVFKVPENLSLDQAAAFPAVYLTAYHALFQNIVIRKNARVLIHSAAGGVGSALLELCRIKDFETTAVVGQSHKAPVAAKLGAHHVIDKSTQNLWREAKKISPNGFDVILDANGAETLKESYNHLAPMGKLICYGFHSMLPKKGGRVNWPKLIWAYIKTPRFNPLDMTNQNKSLITFNLSYLFDQKDIFTEAMHELLNLIESGHIKGPQTTVINFDDVALAHKSLESGKTTGKIVLKC